MLPHQLTRLAQRASIGLAQVGAHGTARNHSGDIFFAISTANALPPQGPTSASFEQYRDLKTGLAHGVVETNMLEVMKNECVDAVFRAASEAVEEAVLNSIVAEGAAGWHPGEEAGKIVGEGVRRGRRTAMGDWLEALPVERVRGLLERYLVVV
jgi:D-aminopeptidase